MTRMLILLRTLDVSSPTEIQIIRQKALTLLARREHSRAELVRKLQQRGYDNELIKSVVEQLACEELLSEARFTASFVRLRVGAGYGPLRISEELRQRGISRLAIQKVLQELQFDWQQLLLNVWQKKFIYPPCSMKEQAQQVRYLLYRGFTSEQVNTLVRQFNQPDFITNDSGC